MLSQHFRLRGIVLHSNISFNFCLDGTRHLSRSFLRVWRFFFQMFLLLLTSNLRAGCAMLCPIYLIKVHFGPDEYRYIWPFGVVCPASSCKQYVNKHYLRDDAIYNMTFTTTETVHLYNTIHKPNNENLVILYYFILTSTIYLPVKNQSKLQEKENYINIVA